MATTSDEPYVERRSGRTFRRILLTLAVLIVAGVLYFLIGAVWVHKIDDDPAFDAQLSVPDGASRTVAVTGQEPGRARLRLAYPPWLFHGLALRQFAPIWEVALRLSAPSGRVACVGEDATGGDFLATWEPA